MRKHDECRKDTRAPVDSPRVLINTAQGQALVSDSLGSLPLHYLMW